MISRVDVANPPKFYPLVEIRLIWRDTNRFGLFSLLFDEPARQMPTPTPPPFPSVANRHYLGGEAADTLRER